MNADSVVLEISMADYTPVRIECAPTTDLNKVIEVAESGVHGVEVWKAEYHVGKLMKIEGVRVVHVRYDGETV